MEIEFCPLPDIAGDRRRYWLGLAVDHHHGLVLASSVLEELPCVDEVACLLADAMEHPHGSGPRRPEVVLLRDHPQWEELCPHLQRLGIDTLITDDLVCWDAKADELVGWLKSHWAPSPMLTLVYEMWGVPENLFKLKVLAHGFVCFGQHEDE